MACSTYSAQDHQSRSGTTYIELGPPPTIINQENTPQAYPGVAAVDIFPIEDLSFKMSLAYFKLT